VIEFTECGEAASDTKLFNLKRRECMKILVVDDSPMMRMAIREELEEGGYEIVEAGNGLEALTKVAVASPPHLITLDIEMPKLNGFQTCDRLRGERYARYFQQFEDRRAPVIFITSCDTLEDRRKGFELGAADFITKPFGKGELLRVVDSILKPTCLSQGMRALVVDDSALARQIVSETLRREGLTVFEAEDGVRAYDTMKTRKNDVDVIITDFVMPYMDGLELCTRIRNELDLKDVPIIFLTAMADQNRLLEVFKSGGTDYIVKPFVREELLARITVHLERQRINRRLRETIEELKKANQEISRLSITDPLTGSFNRSYLNSQLPKEIRRVDRYHSVASIVLCDIDHFKMVNDNWGHLVGDRVLQLFVQCIKGEIRDGLDWVTRYGGEEFLIVLPETDLKGAYALSERLRNNVSQMAIDAGDSSTLRITASFGVTSFDASSPDDKKSPDFIVNKADKNLYQAKQEGRNRVVAC
jgi:two-component system, cell cycle response regulator